MKLEVNTVIGERPNQILMRTGQFGAAVSFISYLGISGFGLELGGHSELAPLVTASFSGVCLAAGAWLAVVQARFDHEKAIAKKPEEPTKGDKEFYAFIVPLLPLTIVEITKLKFAYDDKKTKPELLTAMIFKRF